MKLHTNETYWSIKHGLIKTFPSLKKNIKTDIVIVGAGISGALIADKLCKEGHEVIILDKKHPGFGSTSASTALLQYEIDTPLKKLIQLRGEKNAVQAYKLCVDSIDGILSICKEHKNVCVDKKPSFQYSSFKNHIIELEKEYLLRKMHQISTPEILYTNDIKKLFSLKKECGILSPDAAVIDPFKLTYSILEKLEMNYNLKIYNNTEITEVFENKNHVLLFTNSNQKITAKKVIFACGYETQRYIKKQVEIPNSTYVILSEPIESNEEFWYKNSLIWETANPYLYMRTTSDNRILIGGKDDKKISSNQRAQSLQQKTKGLLNSFQNLYPQINFKIDFSWAGRFSGTKDGLPYIGALPESKNIYYAMCFGGNGITYSYIASNIISDLMSSKISDSDNIFSFNR